MSPTAKPAPQASAVATSPPAMNPISCNRSPSDRERYGDGQPFCLVQKRMPPALQQIQPAFVHGIVSHET
jgi:hypothetical protein